MKQKPLYKITSIFIAFIVVFSTLSFSVEKHFCGTHLIDVAVFSKVKKCGMEMNSQTPFKKKCCKDEVEIVKGLDDFKSNTFSGTSFSIHYVLVAHFYSYINLFESLPKQIIPHKDYSPPDLVYDILVLDAVYLI